MVKKGRSLKEFGVVQTCRESKGNGWYHRDNFILGRFRCSSQAEVEMKRSARKLKHRSRYRLVFTGWVKSYVRSWTVAGIHAKGPMGKRDSGACVVRMCVTEASLRRSWGLS